MTYVAQTTLQKCQRVPVGFDKSSVLSENLTRAVIGYFDYGKNTRHFTDVWKLFIIQVIRQYGQCPNVKGTTNSWLVVHCIACEGGHPMSRQCNNSSQITTRPFKVRGGIYAQYRAPWSGKMSRFVQVFLVQLGFVFLIVLCLVLFIINRTF